MELIFDGMFALGLTLAGFWVWSLRGSVTRDKAVAQRAKEQAEREARLHRKGERLRCLGCEKAFRGPLPETGCPHCHLSSFVVPEAECQEKAKK